MPHRTPLYITTAPESEPVIGLGGHPQLVRTASEARRVCRDRQPRVAILDLRPDPRAALALMRECLADAPGTRFLVIAPEGEIDTAVAAMRAGAFDVLQPRVQSARTDAALLAALDDPAPARPGPAGTGPGGMIGSSAAMLATYAQIRAVSSSNATVFITGESGTGKELCARAIHAASRRRAGPFIALNCGGIPGDLLESEVFGHVRGAFTGAIADRPGAAAQADGGTLFLDEICELDPGIQSKLLRFLETSEITPVGAPRARRVDVRIVCATNREPGAEVTAGHFRRDLFYRLQVLPLHMPALRERGEDVIEIAETLLGRLSAEEGRQFTGLSPAASDIFRRHSWPGNVRELINLLRQVVVMNPGPLVLAEMLPRSMPETAATAAPASSPLQLSQLIGLRMTEIERLVIEATLAAEGGSVPRAAEVLGLAPSTLYRKKDGWRGP